MQADSNNGKTAQQDDDITEFAEIYDLEISDEEMEATGQQELEDLDCFLSNNQRTNGEALHSESAIFQKQYQEEVDEKFAETLQAQEYHQSNPHNTFSSENSVNHTALNPFTFFASSSRQSSKEPLSRAFKPILFICPNQQDGYFEIDVPSDGSCLFYAVALSCLVPILNDEKAFQHYFDQLFGNDCFCTANELRTILLDYDGSADFILKQNIRLEMLVDGCFRQQIVKFMQEHADDFKQFFDETETFAERLIKIAKPKTWGDESEITAMSHILKKQFIVYTADLQQIHVVHGREYDTKIYLVYTAVSVSENARENHYHYLIASKYMWELPEFRKKNLSYYLLKRTSYIVPKKSTSVLSESRKAIQSFIEMADDLLSKKQYIEAEDNYNQAIANANALRLRHDDDQESPKLLTRAFYQLSCLQTELGKTITTDSAEREKIGSYFLKAAMFLQASLAIQRKYSIHIEIPRLIITSEKIEQLYLAAIGKNGANQISVNATKMYRLWNEIRRYSETALTELELLAANKPEDQQQFFIHAEKVRSIFNEIALKIKSFLNKLTTDAIAALGMPPCRFAIICLGSLAKKAATPYSDFEFAILLPEGQDTPENKFYFRKLSYLIAIKIISLGQTAIPSNLFETKEMKGANFDDILIPGFQFDLGGKTPLGRKDKNYDLIQTPIKMAKYLKDEHFATDKLLPIELSSFSYLSINHSLSEESLFETFNGEVKKFFMSQSQDKKLVTHKLRAIKILYQGVADLKPDLEKYETQLHKQSHEGKLFAVKQEIYRLPDRLLEGLALYYGINGETLWEKIDLIATKIKLNEEAKKNLKIIDSIANEIRLRTYLHNQGQVETMPAINDSFIENDERIIENIFKIKIVYLIRYYCTAIPLHNLVTSICRNPTDNCNNENLCALTLENEGLVYKRLGRYDQARACFEKWLDTDRNNAQARLYAGIMCFILSDYNQALKRLNEALELAHAEAKEKRLPIIEALAVTYYSLAQYDKAAEYYIKIIHDSPGRLSKEYGGEFLSNFALLARQLGDYTRAERALLTSLEIQKGLNPSQSNPDLAFINNSLAILYEAKGELLKALELHKKTLTLRLSCYGLQPNIYTASTLENLAVICQQLSLYEDAGYYRAWAEAMQKTIFGEGASHADIHSSLHNRAAFSLAQHDYEQAKKLHKQALTKRRSLYTQSPDHPEIAQSLDNLGLVFRKLNNYEKALDYHQQAYNMRKKIYSNKIYRKIVAGPNKQARTKQNQHTWDHLEKVASLQNLSAVYFLNGNYTEAEKYADEALKMLKRLNGDNPHIQHAEILNDLGLVYFQYGNYSKAIDTHYKAISIQKSIFKQYKPYCMYESYSRLATCYFKMNNFVQARACYQEAFNILQTIKTVKVNLDKAKLLVNLAKIYLEKYRFKGHHYKYKNENFDKAISHFMQAIDYYTIQLKEVSDKTIIYKKITKIYGWLAQCYHHKANNFTNEGKSTYSITVKQELMAKENYCLKLALYFYDKYLNNNFDLKNNRAFALLNMGLIYEAWKQYKIAAQLFKEAHQCLCTLFGRNHRRAISARRKIGSAFQNMGLIYKEMKHYKAAAEAFKEAHEYFSETFGEKDSRTISVNKQAKKCRKKSKNDYYDDKNMQDDSQENNHFIKRP